jgi:DNA-binding NtrC family response regulator
MIGEDPEEVRSYLLGNMSADGLIETPGVSEGSVKLGEDEFAEKDKGDDLESLKAISARATEEIERKLILTALKAAGWNKREAAKMLKISYKSLFNKINAFGIGS